MTEAMLNFDDDVPLPKRRGRPAGAAAKQPIPFDEFPVGKSLFLAGANPCTVSGAVSAYERRFPEKEFVMRYLDSDPKAKVAGVRVWRMR
jgi:hypothetical protein